MSSDCVQGSRVHFGAQWRNGKHKHLTRPERCNFRIGNKKFMENFLQDASLGQVVLLCVAEHQKVGFR